LFKEGFEQISIAEVIIDIVTFKKMDLPGFLPNDVFVNRIRKEIDALKQPVRSFIDKVKATNRKALKYGLDRICTSHRLSREFLQR